MRCLEFHAGLRRVTELFEAFIKSPSMRDRSGKSKRRCSRLGVKQVGGCGCGSFRCLIQGPSSYSTNQRSHVGASFFRPDEVDQLNTDKTMFRCSPI